MARASDWLRERIAPLRDNYGDEAYERLLDDADRALAIQPDYWANPPLPEEQLDFEYFGNQTGTQMHGALVRACLKCGVLVATSAKHVKWHEDQK